MKAEAAGRAVCEGEGCSEQYWGPGTLMRMRKLAGPSSNGATLLLPASWWCVSWAKASCLSRSLGWASLSHQCHLSPFSCSRQFTPLWESNQPHITMHNTHTRAHTEVRLKRTGWVWLCALVWLHSFPLWMVQIYAYGKIVVPLGHSDKMFPNLFLKSHFVKQKLTFSNQKLFWDWELLNMQHIVKRPYTNPSTLF